MVIWNLTIQNNATKDISTFRTRNVSENDLYLVLDFNSETAQEWINKQDDGEYTYYAWAMDSSIDADWLNDYNNGGSTILDNDVVNIHTGERVRIGDLTPIVGLLRIGDTPAVTDNAYDNNKWLTYYYEK